MLRWHGQGKLHLLILTLYLKQTLFEQGWQFYYQQSWALRYFLTYAQERNICAMMVRVASNKIRIAGCICMMGTEVQHKYVFCEG